MAINITLVLVIVTSIVSIAAFNNQTIFNKLVFAPYRMHSKREWYRFFSHGLLHVDWIHLMVNMFVLFEFGRMVEEVFIMLFGVLGRFLFLLMYLAAFAFSSLAAFQKHYNHPNYSAVGASGAVAAVVFAFILFNPAAKLSLMLIPFLPLNAALFGGIYLAYSAYMARRGSDNIGHGAHFWGAIFGFVFPIIFKPSLFTYFLQQIGLG